MEYTNILNTFSEYFSKSLNDFNETTFHTTIAQLNELGSSKYQSPEQNHFLQKRVYDEQYRAIKKFANSWSKCNKTMYIETTRDKLRNYLTDYRLGQGLQQFNLAKINKSTFKSLKANGVTSYLHMNARMVLYKDVLAAIESLERIVTEPVEYTKDLGYTLTKLIQQIKDTHFDITDLDNTKIYDYTKFIDIRSGFCINDTKTLGDLGYSPIDIFRFASSMKKMKNTIFSASATLQDKIKTQPDPLSKSTSTTITGLLYYSLDEPLEKIPIVAETRLYRIAMLNSIFQAVCHYAFELDYETTINLLNAAISIQEG